MKKLLNLALVVLAASFAMAASSPPSVTLAWDQSTEPEVGSYRIYYGSATGNYTNTVTVLGAANTSLVVSNLVRGVTYYFAASCVATNGLESDLSSEVSYRALPLPSRPRNLTVTPLRL